MIQEFKEIVANRHGVAKEKRDQGRKIVGWLCTNVPEELLYAAGMHPIRVIGGTADTAKADGYLYSNVCSFARSCLQEVFDESYDYLDGMVTVNSCDNIRRLYDVWSEYIKTRFVHLLRLPHKISETSIAFYRDELVQLKEKLEKVSGNKISDDGLHQAIALYNRTRDLLNKLYELRKNSSPPITGAETLDVVLAGMFLDKEEYNQKLEALLDYLKGRKIDGKDELRILVVGSELDNSDYIKIIEDAGAIVVADDLCTGSRYFTDPVGTDGDSLQALAKRYISKTPCARMYPVSKIFTHVKEQIKAYKVQGIVYEVIKFCDTYGENVPLFRNFIKDLDIPVLQLSREYALSGVGQMKTRIQAFFESIER